MSNKKFGKFGNSATLDLIANFLASNSSGEGGESNEAKIVVLAVLIRKLWSLLNVFKNRNFYIYIFFTILTIYSILLYELNKTVYRNEFDNMSRETSVFSILP
jgi:hypothetical protein